VIASTGRPRAAARALVSLALLCAAAPARAAEGWRLWPGPRYESGSFELGLVGYVQADARRYGNWDAGDEDTGRLRARPEEFRRVRVGVEGEWRRLSFELVADPQDDGDELKDAFLELELAKALRVRGGHFKLPVSREFLTSAARTDFVERSQLATHLGPARDVGLMLEGELGRVQYQAGMFAGDGRTRHDRAEATLAARLVYAPIDGVELGVSGTHGDVEPEPETPGGAPRAKGFLGEGPTGFVFFEPRFVKGRRLRAGAEMAVVHGPLSVKGEYLHGREQRRGQGAVFDDLPEEVVHGWSASATWLVTGERKKRSVEPLRPLPRGFGAIELGARVDMLRFDDTGPDGGFEGVGDRARNIRPAADRVVTGGLSWWPVEFLRFMGNVVVERFDDPLLAPEPGRSGDYVSVLARVQFQIP
jgi:phosphate-selective porin